MRHRLGRPLKFEFLETRSMMAGNVMAAQVGGDLVIEGDNLDNNVRLEYVAANQYQVFGDVDDGPADTTINGQDTSVVGGIAISGVTGNVIIRLHGGNDRVQVGHDLAMVVHKALIVDGGAGDDVVEFYSVHGSSVGTELLANLGDGNDSFDTRASNIGTSAVLDLGAGHDRAGFTGNSIDGDLVVRGGAGGDLVGFTFATIHGFTVLDGGAEPDRLYGSSSLFGRHAAFFGGAGADRVAFSASRFDSGLLSHLGADFGNTELIFCAANTVTVVGEGPHQIVFSGLLARRVELGLSDSNDTVHIEAAAIDEFYAALNGGDDQVVLRSTAMAGGASIAGGGGFDRLVNEGNLLAGLHLFGFEEPWSIGSQIIRRVA